MGYDLITITCNSNQFKTVEEAFFKVQKALSEELSFYYYIARLEQDEFGAWSRIQQDLETLLTLQRSWYRRRPWREATLLKQLFTELVSFQSARIMAQGRVSKMQRNLSRTRGDILVKDILARQTQELWTPPIKETMELVRYYEDRFLRTAQMLVALLAAVIGGVIGTLLTLAFNSARSIPATLQPDITVTPSTTWPATQAVTKTDPRTKKR